MPSEQPPTRDNCPTCGSPVEVVSGGEGTHHYRPAQPEQPRGEGRGFTREELRRDTYLPGEDDPAPPRGEGDDLAARLDELSGAVSLGFPGTPEQYEELMNDLLDCARLARASTHPEQSVRVEAMEKVLRWYADPDHWLDGQAGEWIVEEGNHVSGDGFAHNEFDHDNGERARVALEPAPPTPTEQSGRVDWTDGNKSPAYLHLVELVERLIQSDLRVGRSITPTARLIASQIAAAGYGPASPTPTEQGEAGCDA